MVQLSANYQRSPPQAQPRSRHAGEAASTARSAGETKGRRCNGSADARRPGSRLLATVARPTSRPGGEVVDPGLKQFADIGEAGLGGDLAAPAFGLAHLAHFPLEGVAFGGEGPPSSGGLACCSRRVGRLRVEQIPAQPWVVVWAEQALRGELGGWPTIQDWRTAVTSR